MLKRTICLSAVIGLGFLNPGETVFLFFCVAVNRSQYVLNALNGTNRILGIQIRIVERRA